MAISKVQQSFFWVFLDDRVRLIDQVQYNFYLKYIISMERSALRIVIRFLMT